jgi:hypothetical protein
MSLFLKSRLFVSNLVKLSTKKTTFLTSTKITTKLIFGAATVGTLGCFCYNYKQSNNFVLFAQKPEKDEFDDVDFIQSKLDKLKESIAEVVKEV